jgi:hypothetical protein
MTNQGTKRNMSIAKEKATTDYPGLSLKNLSSYDKEIGDEVMILVKAKLVSEERGRQYGTEAGKSKESRCNFEVIEAGILPHKDSIKGAFDSVREKAKEA